MPHILSQPGFSLRDWHYTKSGPLIFFVQLEVKFDFTAKETDVKPCLGCMMFNFACVLSCKSMQEGEYHLGI